MTSQNEKKTHSIATKFSRIGLSYSTYYVLFGKALPALNNTGLIGEFDKKIFGTFTERPNPLYTTGYIIGYSLLLNHIKTMLTEVTTTKQVEAAVEEEAAEQQANDQYYQDFKHNFAQSLIGASIGVFYRLYKTQTDIGFSPPSIAPISSFVEKHPALCSLVLTTPLVYKSVRDYTAEKKQSNQDLDDGAPEAAQGL